MNWGVAVFIVCYRRITWILNTDCAKEQLLKSSLRIIFLKNHPLERCIFVSTGEIILSTVPITVSFSVVILVAFSALIWIDESVVSG